MNIRLVARAAGVSVATVSRVFNAPDVVRADTRARVLEVAARFNYTPNANARSLRTQRSKVLGVMLPTLQNPVFGECLVGIAAAAAQEGYAIQLMTSEYRLRDEEENVQQLLARGVDGMVLVVGHPGSSRALRALAKARLPYVLAYNCHPEHPCVSVDGESAIAGVVDMLYARGHRRIAMLCGELASSDRAQARYSGFLRGFEQLGLPAGPMVEVPYLHDVAAGLADLMRAPVRPSALVCASDLLAMGALRAAHTAGLRVPRDLSITGFDGIALGRMLVPSLCTVAQPNREIGQTCVQLLTPAATEGVPLPRNASRTLQCQLFQGESVSFPTPDTYA